MNKTRILLADNNLNENTSIKTFVDKLNNDPDIFIVFASSYKEAISYVNDNKPDFIVLYDNKASNILENPTINSPKESDKSNNIPLIFISSEDQIKNKLIEYEELKKRVSILEEISITDALTGLYNRRHLDHRLPEEVARANRHNLDISCLIVDIDEFKNINDNFGHKKGDIALIKTGSIILDLCRETDIVCRYGGDEFFIILPETDKDGAIFLANRILKKIENKIFILSNIQKQLTVSIGLSYKLPKESKSPQLMLEQADTSLYKAKVNGKNKLVIFKE